MAQGTQLTRIRHWRRAVVAGALVSSLTLTGLVGASIAETASGSANETTTVPSRGTSTASDSGVSSSTSSSIDATTGGS